MLCADSSRTQALSAGLTFKAPLSFVLDPILVRFAKLRVVGSVCVGQSPTVATTPS